ncbi:hypothetical protein D3C80_1361660 [compost metagenome]
MRHHQACVFSRTVRRQFRICHVGADTFLFRDIFQAIADHFATFNCRVDQCFRFLRFIDDLTDQSDAFTQPLIVSFFFISQSRVHFGFLARSIMAQRNGHHGNA